jgi:glutathione S-transferase
VTKAEVKEIIQDFILITYDIPANAKALRKSFLKAAHAIGAEAHTASVYLIPFSEEAMGWANELESAGHAIVWKAHQPDEKKALEITTKYSEAIKARCDYIEQRIAMSQDYVNEGRLKMAMKMGVKTGNLLQQLVQISQHFNPEWLKPRIEELFTKLKAVYDKGKDDEEEQPESESGAAE